VDRLHYFVTLNFRPERLRLLAITNVKYLSLHHCFFASIMPSLFVSIYSTVVLASSLLNLFHLFAGYCDCLRNSVCVTVTVTVTVCDCDRVTEWCNEERFWVVGVLCGVLGSGVCV
jgi:hypothetical protein